MQISKLIKKDLDQLFSLVYLQMHIDYHNIKFHQFGLKNYYISHFKI